MDSDRLNNVIGLIPAAFKESLELACLYIEVEWPNVAEIATTGEVRAALAAGV